MFYRLTVIILIACLLAPASFAQDSGMLLRGTVNQQNFVNSGATGLNRGDLKNAEDAFGKGGDSSLPTVGGKFEPPATAFNFNSATPPLAPQTAVPGLDQNANTSNQQPFNLGAQQEDTNLQPGQADPDNTPALQLAWDQWHKRVATAIYERFNSMAQLAFAFSQPLACYVTYTVTRDGRITNVQLQQKSNNVAFNVMVMTVIGSISGQTDLLAFPPGSQRNFVSKAGMFTQNYGSIQGFKYTTGDKETIPAAAH